MSVYISVQDHMAVCHTWHTSNNYRGGNSELFEYHSRQEAGGQMPNTSPICWTTDFSKLQISKLKLSAEVEKFPETEDEPCL